MGMGSLKEMFSPWPALGGLKGPGPRVWTTLVDPTLLSCASKSSKISAPNALLLWLKHGIEPQIPPKMWAALCAAEQMGLRGVAGAPHIPVLRSSRLKPSCVHLHSPWGVNNLLLGELCLLRLKLKRIWVQVRAPSSCPPSSAGFRD